MSTNELSANILVTLIYQTGIFQDQSNLEYLKSF